MSLHISCPYCARSVEVPDDFLGAGVHCPHCRVVFAVQQTGVTTVAPPQVDNLPYEIIGPGLVTECALPRAARYEPGRGKWLLALGCSSIALALLGLNAGWLALGTPVLFGPPAFTLGLVTWIMGQRDMEKLRRAVIDPYADRLTLLGWVSGIIGTLLGVIVMLCGLGGLFILMLKATAPLDS